MITIMTSSLSQLLGPWSCCGVASYLEGGDEGRGDQVDLLQRRALGRPEGEDDVLEAEEGDEDEGGAGRRPGRRRVTDTDVVRSTETPAAPHSP